MVQDNTALVHAQNESPVKHDINNTIYQAFNSLNNALSVTNTAINYMAAVQNANLQIHTMDVELNRFMTEIGEDDRKRADKINVIREIHERIDAIIARLLTLMENPNLNELQLTLANKMVDIVLNAQNKMPQL